MEVIEKTDIFTQLLLAREQRQKQKLALINGGCHLVSLQLNVPGLPKSSALLYKFIKLVDEAFSHHLISINPNNQWCKKHQIEDMAGDSILYLFKEKQIDASVLKEITEEFEQTFELGRIVDLDVLSASGQPIASGRDKPCFICSKPAALCRKDRAHFIDEVRDAMHKAIGDFVTIHEDKELIRKVAGFAISAMLHEVALSPKPGLVCRNSCGAHTDMDYVSFINSVAALSPYFIEINTLALNYTGKDVAKALPKIRTIGLKMERAMYQSTNGVNTHKGAVFLMALSAFAIIRVVKKQGYFKKNSYSSVIQQLSRGIVQRELCMINTADTITHGQQCFQKYGLQAAGARGEAEQGMPTVLHHALPYLKGIISKPIVRYSDKELSKVLKPTLLKILSVNNDTNVLYRHGIEVLDTLKEKSTKALKAWTNGDEGKYNELIKWCNQKCISPGGGADLLALTLMIYQCETEFAKK